VRGYFYNPNIHPYSEYKKRLDAVIEYNNRLKIDYVIENSYGLREFIRMEAETDNRCKECYCIRLEKTVKYAATEGFEAFTTTLLYSRRQKHDLIRAACEETAQKYKLRFLYEDYRTGWQTGIDISKKLSMYRQQYCGCIFSEEERYNPISKAVRIR
jgi:predicted adenine nucleotide alpha hydrolase (AANH) superfamily ATPase